MHPEPDRRELRMTPQQATGGSDPTDCQTLVQIAPEVLRDLMRCCGDPAGVSLLGTVLGRIGAATGASGVIVLERTPPVWTCRQRWQAGVAAGGSFDPELPLAETDTALRTLEAGTAPPSARDLLAPLLDAPDLESGSCTIVAATAGAPAEGALILALPPGSARPGDQALRLLSVLADALAILMARWRADREAEATRREQSLAVARLTATLAAHPDLLLELDADGRCLDYHCNRPELLATAAARIMGRTLEETVPPDVARMQRAAMARALRDGTAEVPPYALGSGPDERWFRTTVSRLQDSGAPEQTGARPRFVFLIRDITAERARSAQQRLLSQIVSDMPLMVLLCDAQMRVRWINPALSRSLGMALPDLIGRPVRDFTDRSRTPPETLQAIDAAVAARRGFEGVVWQQAKDGPRAKEIMLRPLDDADGRPAGFVSIERDITDSLAHEAERKHLSGQAEDARRRLEAALNALPDGFVIYDSDGCLVMWNQQFAALNAPIAHLLEPGRHRDELLAAASAAGHLPDPVREQLQPEQMLRDEGQSWRELSLADGRHLRAMARRMPDGGHVMLLSDITDIRDTRQRLADVIEGARVATWDMDFVTGIETVNDHWAAMLGEPAGSIRQIDADHWFDRLHPDDAKWIRAQMSRIDQGPDDRLDGEFRLRHRAGHWVHVVTRGRVIARNARGRPLRMSGIDIDVTEQRRTEARLQSIVDASSVGTWQLDLCSGGLIIDDAYARLLGRRRDELEPMNLDRFQALTHPDDLPEVEARARAAAESGADEIRHEFRMRHADGSWRWVLAKSRFQAWDADGQPTRESGVILDITEARARERALAEARDALAAALEAHERAERRLADIAAASRDWFWERDAQERFTYLSNGFERATGYAPGPFLGKTRQELGLDTTPTIGETWDDLERRVAERAPIENFIYGTRRRTDGRLIWVRTHGGPFYDSDGNYAGYRGVSADVTELIEATARAREASRAKSSFLATMSHELRTPMTAVLGLAELMQDRVQDPELSEMLGTIRDSGAGLLSVLDDILDLAKIEAGKLMVDPEPFVPADLARRCAALFGQRARAAGLDFGVTVWPGGDSLRLGDANRILQILNNLIGNAIKFTRTGGVRLSIAPAGPQPDSAIRFTIEDDGIGMSRDQLARVFEEFEQAESTTSRRFGGTGLGLSIVRRLVGLLNGTLDVDSHEGAGTRISVTLPLPPAVDQPEQAEPSALPPPPPRASLAGLRVLVADDNATNRRILKAMLNGLGLTVTLAEDGRQALSQYRPGAFDLLILDIAMPEMDGPCALAAIRELDAAARAPSLPALAVTAHAMAHQIAEILNAGFAGHLAKPFSKAGLAKALEDCLNGAAPSPLAAPSALA